MSRRFCVFCGEAPQEKTNEHVLPRWLIEITGDPKRLMQIGPFVTQKEYTKQFSFDQFRFPACSQCNETFSRLESRAKSVMQNLLALRETAADGFDILLDWFDKVRVGLWLGYHQYLDKNIFQVKPNFYIGDRIAKADRALLIYRLKNVNKGLRFIGINMPAFAHAPMCFSLVVNDLLFCNVSTAYLLARRAGLPYPKHMGFREDGSMVALLPFQPGAQEIKYPVLGFNYNRECTVVAQPIINNFPQDHPGEVVEKALISQEKSRLIIQNNSQARFYPEGNVLDWVPAEKHEAEPMVSRFATQTLQMQNDMLRRTKMWKDETKEVKRRFSYQRNHCIKINEKFIAHTKKELSSLE